VPVKGAYLRVVESELDEDEDEDEDA